VTLNRQAAPSLGAAALKHRPTVFGRHPLSVTVFSLPFLLLRLPGPLGHGDRIAQFVNGGQERERRRGVCSAINLLVIHKKFPLESLWITRYAGDRGTTCPGFWSLTANPLSLPSMNATTLWKKTVKELEQHFPRNSFGIWIKPTVALNLTNNRLVVGTPSVYVKSILKKRYYQKIKKVVDDVSGRDFEIEFVVSEKALSVKKTAPPGPLFAQEENGEEKPKAGKRAKQKEASPPRYTFETFIVGNSNNFAHAAAQAIVESPGDTYNPLFIYGGTGVGKTHLLQAIRHALSSQHPGFEVLYLACEQFTNKIITALKQGNIQTIREKFRGADAFLVDDIQFIAGKDFSQEEFFNTFNQLYLANKQIVICSDRPPRDIPKLESRLASRFLGGLTVDIQPPDYEMRAAIIKTKASERGVELPDDIVDLLAKRIQTNIRELEGILFSILTATKFENVEPSREFIEKKLGGVGRQPRAVKPKEVLSAVAQHFGLKVKDLTGKSRRAELVLPRQIAMFLLRQEFRQSFEGVGDLLGGRDHTTIMHGVNKIEKLIKENHEIHKDYLHLRERLV
jgi:chromosomal replication initiator protein